VPINAVLSLWMYHIEHMSLLCAKLSGGEVIPLSVFLLTYR